MVGKETNENSQPFTKGAPKHLSKLPFPAKKPWIVVAPASLFFFFFCRSHFSTRYFECEHSSVIGHQERQSFYILCQFVSTSEHINSKQIRNNSHVTKSTVIGMLPIFPLFLIPNAPFSGRPFPPWTGEKLVRASSFRGCRKVFSESEKKNFFLSSSLQ